MYEKINQKYMNASKDNIMFFEPGQAPDAEEGLVFSVGFKTPPGGEIGSPNHVLNDHTYCCVRAASMCKTGEPDVNKGAECLAWHQKKLNSR